MGTQTPFFTYLPSAENLILNPIRSDRSPRWLKLKVTKLTGWQALWSSQPPYTT